MVDTPDQFKRKPRQKKAPGKRVTISPEAKQAYEDLLRDRDERERTYAQFLPSSDKVR